MYVNIVNNLLNNLGFYINFEKLSIEPSHSRSRLYLEHFNMSILLPYDKIITRKFAYQVHINVQIHINKYTLRETISFLGMVVTHSFAFKFSPLHYRPIQLCYIDNVNRGKIIRIFSFFSFDDGSVDHFLGDFLALMFSLHSVSYHFPCKDCAVNYVRQYLCCVLYME